MNYNRILTLHSSITNDEFKATKEVEQTAYFSLTMDSLFSNKCLFNPCFLMLLYLLIYIFLPRYRRILFRFENNHESVVHNIEPIINLKKAIYDLKFGNVNSEVLQRSVRLCKNPDEYENENDLIRKIGLASWSKERR